MTYAKPFLAAASAGLMLAAAACGHPSLAPAVKLGQQADGQAVAASQAPASASAASASQAAATSAQSQPASAQAAGNSTGSTVLTLNSSNSTAEYQTQEQLAGRNLPNVAVGSTSGVSGSLTLTADGQLAQAERITVDLTTLKSDESMRDNFVQRNTLQTTQYPTTVFSPSAITGLSSLPTSGSSTFQMSGDLTVHGVTKPLTWTVTAQFQNGQVSGKATAPFTITEFGMTLPKAGPVLSVQDAGTLELDFSNVTLTAAG